MSLLDVHRFDSLSDQQIVRRIGSLLAVALMRSGALSTAVATAALHPGSAKPVEATRHSRRASARKRWIDGLDTGRVPKRYEV